MIIRYLDPQGDKKGMNSKLESINSNGGMKASDMMYNCCRKAANDLAVGTPWISPFGAAVPRPCMGMCLANCHCKTPIQKALWWLPQNSYAIPFWVSGP